MAGRRRRGNAAASGLNLFTELVMQRQAEDRKFKQRAVEMAAEMQGKKDLLAYQSYLEGKADYDPLTGQYSPKQPTAPEPKKFGLTLNKYKDPITGAEYDRGESSDKNPLLSSSLSNLARLIWQSQPEDSQMTPEESFARAAQMTNVSLPAGYPQAPTESAPTANVGGPLDTMTRALQYTGSSLAGGPAGLMAAQGVNAIKGIIAPKATKRKATRGGVDWQSIGLPDPMSVQDGTTYTDDATGERWRVANGNWISE